MTRRPLILTLSKRNRLPRTITGDGLILVSGKKPTNIKYEIDVVQNIDSVSAIGKVWGNISHLYQLWMMPVLCLKLENSDRIEVSITELKKEYAVIIVIN
ncbi:hypothetical protein [Methylobacterium sp. WL120]|uniref:hypothetical protein n=1 Tax=Methylobacterium sp. WL120 TaxID=2603887 RepID=UPI0011C8A4B2|nr:hypothetical protein [Methylobacterium sp. WL120]TXM64596.1 hypothetical protein FV229_18040 [Methylobacterium sp. WL120]